MIQPLWERALEQRRAEQARPRRIEGHKTRNGCNAGRPRTYALAQIGDRFGPLEVVRLLPLGSLGGRREEAVRVRCPAGHEKDAFITTLRRRQACRMCRWPGARRA